MASLPPAPRSRPSVARRAGIAACAVLTLIAAMTHAIGGRTALEILAALAVIAVLFLVIRRVRNRRPGGISLPGLRPGRGMLGFPGRMPGMGRMPRGLGRPPGLPRGFPGRAMPTGFPGLARRMRGPLGAVGIAGGPGRRGIRRTRSGRALPFPGQGGPRSARSVVSRPGPSRSARTRPGSSSGTGRRIPGGAGRPSPGTRASRGARRALGFLPGRSRGSAASGGRSRSGASGARPGSSRPGPPRSGSRARGARLWRRYLPGFRSGRAGAGGWRSGRAAARPPRSRRGRRFPFPGRRPAGMPAPRIRVRRPGSRLSRLARRIRFRRGPRPVRPYGRRARLVPRTLRSWRRRLHRRRVRLGRSWRIFSRAVRRRGFIAAFLLSFRRRKTGRAPGVTVRPPRRSGDPDDERMPPPARPAPRFNVTPPRPAGTPFAPSGGTSMASPFAGLIDSIPEAFKKVDPNDPLEINDMFADLVKVVESLGGSVTSLAERTREEFPVRQSVADELGEVGSALNGVRDKAQELLALFRRVHEDDLNRAENPRPGERRWNVVS